MAKIKKIVRQEEQLSSLIAKRFNASLNYQRTLFTNYNEYYQLYRSLSNKQKQSYVGRANLFIPRIYTVVETILPRMLGQKPKIEAVPREISDIERSSMATNVLSYYWDIMGMRRKLKLWVKQTLIYGTGVLKLAWEYDEASKKDAPRADVVDLFDFFYDPDATCMEDAQYCIQRKEVCLEYLKNNENYEVPEQLVAETSADEYKVQRDAFLGLHKPEDKDKQLVEILEYWGKADIDGSGEAVEAKIVVANQKYILQAIKNPYDHQKKPFIIMIDTQMPQEFCGIGEVEPLKYLQYELNSTRNQRLDNVTLILNRMWVVDKNADVEESELVSQSGQIIHTGDMKGIEPLPTPDVTASAYNEEGMIKSDIQDASGISDYVTGQGASGKQGQAIEQTATGIALYQEAGNARIKFKLDNMEDALREFGLQLMALLQQFLTQEFVIRIVGAEGKYWKRVTPEEIQGNFDLTVEAGSTQPLNKSMRRAQAREIVNTLVPLLKTPQGQQINLQYYLKYLLESYELTNIDEAFNQQPIVPEVPPGQGGGQAESPLAGTGTSRGMAPDPGIFAPDAINGGADMVANAPTG